MQKIRNASIIWGGYEFGRCGFNIFLPEKQFKSNWKEKTDWINQNVIENCRLKWVNTGFFEANTQCDSEKNDQMWRNLHFVLSFFNNSLRSNEHWIITWNGIIPKECNDDVNLLLSMNTNNKFCIYNLRVIARVKWPNREVTNWNRDFFKIMTLMCGWL